MDDKEDLRKRIYQCLDRMGPYHILLLSAFATFSLTAGYSNSVPVFYTFTPGFKCGDQEQNQCEGVSSPSNCTFDPEEIYDSIVTDYHLVCGNRYLAALSTTIYFAGVTIGALIFGPLSDYIGRRKTLQITTIGHILMGFCIHFEALTPSIAAFIVLRFIQGAWNQGMQTIAYTSLIELTPVRFRTLMGCIWEALWSLGMIYVAVISSFTYQWRTLQLYMLIPTALGVLATFFIPESMHWQWTRNSFQEIMGTYQMIARKNKDTDFLEEEKRFQLDKDWEKVKEKCQAEEQESEGKVSTSVVLKMIFQSRILRKHILAMALFWFTVTVTYYAITFFVPNLGGNRHQNVMMGGGVEICGYVVLFFAMKRFGRSRVLGIFAISSAALCIIFAITELVPSIDAVTKDTTGIVVLILAKALAISAFCGMYIYTGELFPTLCRGTTFGICGFWSRVGSLIAPQIIRATEVVNPGLPMFLIGGLLTCAGGLMFILPETLRIQIPNTMQDVEDLWGTKSRKEQQEELRTVQ